MLAEQHLREHQAQGENIGLAINRCAQALFGGHVAAGPGDGAARRATDQVLGNAEVGERHALVPAEEDVGRLHVAVDKPLVGIRQPTADGESNVNGRLPGQRAVADEARRERFSRDVLQHEGQALRGRVIVKAVEANDVGRIQPFEQPGFPLPPGRDLRRIAARLVACHLEGHDGAASPVPGTIDGRGAAPTNQGAKLELLGEHGARLQ